MSNQTETKSSLASALVDVFKNPKKLAAVAGIIIIFLSALGVISQNNADYALQQLDDLTSRIAELEANQTRIQNTLDQPIGSTLSAMRKGYGFQVSFATNSGVPAATLTLQSGVNGSVVTLAYSATNYTYVAEKAITAAAAINGSIYFAEGDYEDSYGDMTIPDIPLGVSVTIDSGAYNYVLSAVYGTLTDYHNNVIIRAGSTARTAADWTIYQDGAIYKAQASNFTVYGTSTNLTALTYSKLTTMTTGTLMLKDVAFDLALKNSIGANVQVVESVGNLTRNFINPLASTGSPYTISVNGANYFAADSYNRIAFASTNLVSDVLQPINDAHLGGGLKIMAQPGVYYLECRFNSTAEFTDFSCIPSWHDTGCTFKTIAGFANSVAIAVSGNGAYFHDFGIEGESRIISLYSAFNVTCLEGIFENIEIDEFLKGLEINSLMTEYKHITIDNCGEDGVYANFGRDNFLLNVGSGYNGYGFRIMRDFTLNRLAFCFTNYTDFGWTIYADNNTYVGCADYQAGGYGVALGGASFNRMTDWTIKDAGRTTHTASAFWLVSSEGRHCTRNVITATIATMGIGLVAHCVLEEDTNQDFNQWLNMDCTGASAEQILTNGANSKTLGYNGTCYEVPTVTP
jgi:hypothetical protein